MEAYYTDELAVLFPFFHIAYWTGLVSNDGLYPNFKWLDYNTRPPGEQWGSAAASDAITLQASGDGWSHHCNVLLMLCAGE